MTNKPNDASRCITKDKARLARGKAEFGEGIKSGLIMSETCITVK